MLFNFQKMIVICILCLILPNSFCSPLNRHSNVQQLEKNKNVHSVGENRIDGNSMAQIKGKDKWNGKTTTIQQQPESSIDDYITFCVSLVDTFAAEVLASIFIACGVTDDSSS
eukprot:XP_016663059.1 PREDICTED: uncharacterized protein LOC107884771 [Acyrthosiphon pisum]